jgi:hypothetical protein
MKCHYWGIRNQAFRIPKWKSVFRCSKFDKKGSVAKPLELLKPFSFLWTHPSTNTLRHLRSSQINRATQGVRVSVRPFSFPYDETPKMNLTHPASLSLGFSRGFRRLWRLMFSSLNLTRVSGDERCHVKGESTKDWRSSPDRRTWWQQERRRDLRRDVMNRRLRGDLIGDLPKIA